MKKVFLSLLLPLLTLGTANGAELVSTDVPTPSAKEVIIRKTDKTWEGSDEKTSTETFNIKWVNNNDDMGSFHVMYADKCITAKHKTPLPLSSRYYFDVPSYTTGSRFTCTILPCKY